jgi:hypothetical protein
MRLRGPIKGQPIHEVDGEGTIGRVVSCIVQGPDHELGGLCVMTVNDEPSVTMLLAVLSAEPANDFHTAVAPVRIDKLFSTQVVVEMHLAPRFRKPTDALLGGLNPDRCRVAGKKERSAGGVVIQEQDAVFVRRFDF